MRREQTIFMAVAAIFLLSTGALSAERLSENRTAHKVRSHRQHTTHTQRAHRTHREHRNHTRQRDRRAHAKTHRAQRHHSGKTATHRSKLLRAKRHQKRIDRQLERRHARYRSFRSVEQYKRQGSRAWKGAKAKRHHSSNYRKHHTRQYHSSWDGCDSWRTGRSQRGYRNTRRNWYLTYLYERAFFYDRYGYEYGYFNRRGFMFEGVFYRYDRGYTYQDRLRGRGLFDHRYYRPISSLWGDFFAGLDREGFYFFAGFDL